MDPIVAVVDFGFLTSLAGGFRKGLSGQCPDGVPVYIFLYA